MLIFVAMENKSKSFIITVDTEGDNLWRYHDGKKINVKNAEYIEPFQVMCQQFNFKPVYLVNYEMAECDLFVNQSREWLSNGNCEIGLHLHAWNNPPFHRLEGRYKGQPYLIEYPKEIMEDKFRIIYNLLCERYNQPPLSHRAGRWAMNEDYFSILNKFGIRIDCSYTPLINWEHSKGRTMGGSNYKNVSLQPSCIDGIFEVPMTVRMTDVPSHRPWYKRFRRERLPRNIWMRPAMQSLNDLESLVDMIEAEPQTDYIEFMIHSSELMPGGSPYCRTDKDVREFLSKIRKIFENVHNRGYQGRTLQEYFTLHHDSAK